MGLQFIDGLDFVRMIQAGVVLLEKNKTRVDALNVFPVPDGDTGTNMYLTLLSAAHEAEKRQDQHIGKVGKAISMGSLMGARGNSGVILSQVFRGMAKELEHKEKVDARGLAAALQAGSDTAYKAVMKPVEGTILTIAREVARSAAAASKKSGDIVEVMQTALESGYRMLERTPQMLPVLKEAGVVDSGGQGFLYLFEGMIKALSAEDLSPGKLAETTAVPFEVETEGESLEFQYCTETLIKGFRLDIDRIRDELEPLGDSMLVVGEDELVKVHIHSNHPGKVLEICLSWGTLHDIKINNMEEETQARLESLAELKNTGLVAVGQGEGWLKIMQSLGVDQVVSGGQTMNPSTEDLLRAVSETRAQGVIILPNNKNIIMAAEQAVELADKPVRVVPTTSITQAVAALVAYESEMELDVVVEAMNEEIGRVKTGEVTVAVKDSSINGLLIKEGDYIGLIDNTIAAKGDSASDMVMELLKSMASDGDLISIFYGADVTEDVAGQLREQVEEAYPDYDVELHYGGQPFYHYLISVE
ncbi:MAG: DAK2 domain-containing protein [Syntrophomonadales bacterium]